MVPSYVRIGFVVVVLGYGAVMLAGLSKTNPSSSSPAASGPMGVKEVLKKSHLRIPPDEPTKQNPSRTEQNVNKPRPVSKYDHHLEEPDIHMQPPGKIATESKPTPADVEKEPVILEKPAAAVPKNDEKATGLHKIVVDKRGTGPTDIAYIQDIRNDRRYPIFREAVTDGEVKSSVVAAKVQEEKVAPCLQLESTGKVHHWTMQAACLDTDTPQIAYNAAPFPRTWCGQDIAPGDAIIMSEHCSDPVVHLFGTETATSSGRGMSPMILRTASANNSVLDAPMLQTVECDIPCQEQPGVILGETSVLQRRFEGEPWTIKQTMVEPSVNSQARVERTNYRQDIYYSTPSFKSDVPLTFYDPDKFSIRNRPAVSYDEALPKGVYMLNTFCSSGASKRFKYFSSLINKGFPVDSIGECNHNTDVPAGKSIETSEGRIEIMKNYRFVLAFDRTKDKDYLSTMVWEALISGSIPIVVSAENMRLHLPKKSFIDFGAYEGWEELADAVIAINASKEEWESYHAWRSDEAELAKFESLYEFSKTNPTCRLCRWGYAKKYGLGWDHAKQQVTETRFSRSLCTTETKGLQVASKPFQEEWISRNEEHEIAVQQGGGTETCVSTVESKIDNGSTYKVERSIFQHDGVIDIFVNNIERETMTQDLVLRLNFPGMQNSDGANFGNTHTTLKDLNHGPIATSISIQDDFSKITILADWSTSITSPVEGTVEIVVVEQQENEDQPESPLQPNIPRRVRVILEDMDIINDKMTEYFPSPFAKRMIKDFVDPLEVYYAAS